MLFELRLNVIGVEVEHCCSLGWTSFDLRLTQLELRLNVKKIEIEVTLNTEEVAVEFCQNPR